jgi:DNA (cytosine-5)-methyltransferase 1
MAKISILDLFSGCGGLSMGLKNAGLHVVAGIDKDEDSITTYSKVHPKSEALCKDISQVFKDKSKYVSSFGGIDVVAGGPPCQGFCAINPKRSVSDPRNTLIDTFFQVSKILKPKFILMENVTGLLSLEKGVALESILNFLKKEKYKVAVKVLQAAHYGVPQHRWRLFVAASRIGEFKFPKPKHKSNSRANFPSGKKYTFDLPVQDTLFEKYSSPTTVWDAISDLPIIENGGGCDVGDYVGINGATDLTQYQKKIRGSCKILYNHKTVKLGKVQEKRIRALPDEGMNWLNLPEDLIPSNLKKLREKYGTGLGCKSRFARLIRHEQFSTILTKPEMYWGTFIHPSQQRVISVREAARGQSFPDKARLFGSLTSQYRQVGNAVPPLLGEALGKAIKKHFEEFA